jgi:hypothetical protein
MQRLLLLGLMLGTGMVGGVRTIPCDTNAIFTIQVGDRYNPASVIASAVVNHPAVFPKEAYITSTSSPYQMNCKGFTASSDAHTFTISGDMNRIWSHINSKHNDSPGTLDILFVSGYIYPAIQEDFYKDFVTVTFPGDSLRFDVSDDAHGMFDKSTIGARVNGGKLVPVFFQGKHSQVAHGNHDVVEIYSRTGSDGYHQPEITYMKVDFKRSVLTIRNDVPFPSK